MESVPQDPCSNGVGLDQSSRSFKWMLTREGDKHLLSLSDVVSATAMWAIRQSPYPVPDNLETACWKLYRMLDPHFEGTLQDFRYGRFTFVEVEQLLATAFGAVPEILAWNSPKSGHDAQYVFTSRYGGPHPDDDIIDLDALSRNAARSVCEEAAEHKRWDDEWEKKRKENS